MVVNNRVDLIGESLFYKFLELYEEKGFTSADLKMFKDTPLFCYLFTYVKVTEALDNMIEEWFSYHEGEELDL